MSKPQFDPSKDAQNQREHGVSLALGVSVLDDAFAVELLDTRFNYGEERWNIFGLVSDTVYVATYTDRDGGPRFISVRKATKRETDAYYRARTSAIEVMK